MTTTDTRIRQATIEADPTVPAVRIVRDFAAPVERVFRAWVDPALVAQWLGPKSTAMDIHAWECSTGGAYRYDAVRGGEVIASFYGCFHEVRASERIVQTFTWAGAPDSVALETATFTDLGDGTTRVSMFSLTDSFQGRDAMLSSGMDVGINEGFDKLDTLLATD